MTTLGRLLGPFLAVVLFMVPSTLGAAGSGEPGPDEAEGTLWSMAEEDGHLVPTWFTTYPPTSDDTTKAVELFQRTGYARTGWELLEPPRNWTLGEGAKVSFRIHMRDIDTSIPDYDPTRGTTPGFLDVRFTLTDGFEQNDHPDPLGSKTFSYRYDQLPQGEVVFDDTFTIERPKEFQMDEDDNALRFLVEVLGGRDLEGSDIDVLVGSIQHGSKITVEGFPWKDAREQETLARAAADCRETSLEGRPCKEVGAEPASDTTQAAPGAMAPVTLLAILAAVHIARRGVFRRPAGK